MYESELRHIIEVPDADLQNIDFRSGCFIRKSVVQSQLHVKES